MFEREAREPLFCSSLTHSTHELQSNHSLIHHIHMQLDYYQRSNTQVLGRGRKLKNSHTDLASLVRRSHVDLMTLARLPKSPPPSPTLSVDNRSDTDDDDNASRISDWSMTPPLDVNTMARAASYSDIRDFFGSGASSRTPSVASNLSNMTAPSPLEILFPGGNSGNSTK